MSAGWSLETTGRVVPSDLVMNAGGKGVVFTGHEPGTALLKATSAGLLTAVGGPISVVERWSSTIGYSQTVAGAIDADGEVDTYTFTGKAGDKVLARVGIESWSAMPGVRVFAPNGTKLAEDSKAVAAEIPGCTLPTDGQYTLQVYDKHHGSYSGDYYLYLQCLNNPANPVSMSLGDTLAASIDMAGEMDGYVFYGQAGGKVRIEMARSSGLMWAGTRVYGPDGALVAVQNSPTSVEMSNVALPRTGKYLVLIYDGFYGFRVGGYDLSVQGM